jgi:diacylglycerol kinase
MPVIDHLSSSSNNMERKRFSTKERLNSFAYAWAGLKAALRTEHNTWIHLFLTILATVLAIYLRISRAEWMALVLSVAMVWTAELFNTVIEKIMDFLSKERHPQIKIIKDMAAAAVLITAIAAVIVGLLIFIPKLF